MAYSISTPLFNGPIDLLLHLVSTHEVDILEVPLAPVVDSFIKVLLERRDELSLDVLSEFLLVAAILVELKSQRLLPGPDGVEDEEELIGWEERDLLLARLLECRAYAGAADAFVQLLEDAAKSVPREVGLDQGFLVHAPDLLAGVTPVMLVNAYIRGTAERPTPRVDLSHVTVDTVTVAEAVAELAPKLERSGIVSFRSLTAHLETRIEVIVRFLAILELCKLGKVSLGQGSTFGDLTIKWVADEFDFDSLQLSKLGIDDYEG